MQSFVRTRKLSDRKLIEIIKKLFEVLPDANVHGNYIGAVAFHASTLDELAKISSKGDERIIQDFVVRSGPQSDEVKFARGIFSNLTERDPGRTFHDFLRLREPSPFFDEIGLFEYPNYTQIGGYRTFDEKLKIEIARIIDKLRAPIQDTAGVEGANLELLLSQSLADLQETTRNFLERSAEARAADEASYQKRLSQLETDFTERTEELRLKREELEKIREEMHDREPQHERRKLRKELTGDLQTFLGKPPEGGFAKRNAVYLMYAAVGLIFIAISLFLTIRLDLSENVQQSLFWANTIKAAVSGIGGAAFIWAGLSGLKGSTESQRRFSQQLQRYSFDMDRASWVVETLLQMNSMESAQVPDVWLEAACRELFAQEPTSDGAGDSLTALAALLDATARAKIGTNGFEFELNKRALRRLANQSPED